MKTKNEYLVIEDNETELISAILETTEQVAKWLGVSKPTAIKIINQHLSYNGYKIETQKREEIEND